MPRASILTKSTAASRRAVQPQFLCSWQTGARAAWISAAGELDLASAPQLRQTLREPPRLLLTRGPTQVDRVLTLTGATEQATIFELDRTEPAPALLATRAAA